MTDDAQPRRDTLRQQRAEMAKALNGTIEDTIRESWLPNTVAWIITVGAAFIINLVLLILLARP
jgi:hypothetical protein